MKTIDVQLVKDNGKQKFYELSEPIRYGKDIFGLVDLEKELGDEYREIKGVHKKFFNKKCSILCVSDAMYHHERIVFVGQNINGNYCRSRPTVCGTMTELIKGGDKSKMYDIEVYLRFLSKLNNVKLKLIK